MKAVNTTQNRTLAANLSVADTFLTSLVGLLGRQTLPLGEGLWITPCQSVHTIGMKFAIDVLFLNQDGVILHLIEGMKPFRISKHLTDARSVLELPKNNIPETHTRLGDRVKITSD